MFTNREGINNFSAASRGGGQKFNRVFHPVSTTPPRELKNDNSLTLPSPKGRGRGFSSITFEQIKLETSNFT